MLGGATLLYLWPFHGTCLGAKISRASGQGKPQQSLDTHCAAAAGAAYGLWHPFMAQLTCNRRITSQDHFQDTRHMEFSLQGSGLSYQPGDLLCIFPRQNQAAIAAFLQHTGLDAEAWVCIEPAEPAPGSRPVAIKVHSSLHCMQACSQTAAAKLCRGLGASTA